MTRRMLTIIILIISVAIIAFFNVIYMLDLANNQVVKALNDVLKYCLIGVY
jgi:hypothetical protein